MPERVGRQRDERRKRANLVADGRCGVGAHAGHHWMPQLRRARMRLEAFSVCELGCDRAKLGGAGPREMRMTLERF